MKVVSFLFSLVAMAVAGAALYQSSPKGLEKTLSGDPQILLNASKSVEKALQEEARAKQEEAARQAEESIVKNLEAFNNDESVPFTGPKDAKVVVVEFFDFACGYCHALAPTLEELIDANADVKFVFKPLAFLSRESAYAASAFVAAQMQGKAYDFYKNVMAINDGLSEEKINKAAEKAGLDLAKMKEDMEGKDVEAALRRTNELARQANINGVPFLILNGKISHVIDKDGLQAAIDAEK